MKKTHQLSGFIVAAILLLLTTAAVKWQSQNDDNRQFKQEFLRRINQVRAKGCNCGSQYMPPAAPLVWNNELENAAGGHADDMARQQYFSHTSKDGRNMEDRMVLSGYTIKGFKSFMVGENIAFGQPSIAEVMNGWINSPGHCKNLMNPGFREVGVAERNNYWVQDFGGRESWSLREQQLIKSGRMRIVREQSGHGD
ncbi:CAP domain-containing protein [Mucilaginibacter sp.]